MATSSTCVHLLCPNIDTIIDLSDSDDDGEDDDDQCDDVDD